MIYVNSFSFHNAGANLSQSWIKPERNSISWDNFTDYSRSLSGLTKDSETHCGLRLTWTILTKRWVGITQYQYENLFI